MKKEGVPTKALDDKQKDILFKIIELYIEKGEPVGSRVLSKLHSVEISPASLRNVMMDLGELSMVSQPHASAGRIPTDKAYRAYVDSLISEGDLVVPDANLEAKFEDLEGNLTDLLKGTADLLAEKSRMMGLVTTPRPNKSRMKKIRFIPLSRCQVLVLMVTKAGMITSRMVQVKEDFNEDFLAGLSEYLNKKFYGRSLSSVRKELLDALSDELSEEPRQFAKALRLGKKAFDLGFSGNLYLSGQNNFFSWSEFNDVSSLEAFFSALENHADILDLLDRHSRSDQIFASIGAEHNIKDLESCSFVCTGYGIGENVLGSVAVLGPKRLDYSRIIPLTKFMAETLSKRLNFIAD